MQRVGAVLFRGPAAFAPAGHRARQEPLGPAEIVQTDRGGIDRVDRGDGFQQHLRQPRAEARTRRQFRRNGFPDDQARPVFEDLEPLAADRRIIAQMQAARHERQRVRQARQDAVLARHVVGAGGQLAHRRAAQHGGFAVQVNQIIEVREPAGELPRRRIVVQPHPVTREVGAARPASPV